MAWIVGAALLIYIGALAWFINRVYLRRFYLRLDPGESRSERYRLAQGVRVVLSALHFFAFLAVIAWLPFSVLMTLSQTDNPAWGVDLDVYSGFTIDIDQLPSVEVTGLRDPVIAGKTDLRIDTSNRTAWMLFAVSNVVVSIIALYVLLQLRNIFVRLSSGEAFSIENASRLKRLGIAVISGFLAQPLVQYFGWGAVLEDISFNTTGIQLTAAYDWNLVGVLVGVGALVLSGVINEASDLKDEQQLTI